MNQEETLALWQQGKEAWNAWAEKMLAERKALEDKGEWEVTIMPWGEKRQSETTKKWLKNARAVFSSEKTPHVFPDATTFEGWLFPSVSEWNVATFNGDTWFDSATFKDVALFSGATFEGVARFSDTTFKGVAGFNSVCFEKPTHFSRTRFNTNASFNSSQIKQAFDLSGARFKEVPDFRQTHCEEAPLLDDVHIDSTIIKQRQSSDEPDFTVTANYRALKRLAILGHDHKHEVEFFAEELRSKRLMVDRNRPLEWMLNGLYQITSDYGRSIFRPVLWWLPVMLVSTALYLSSSTTNTAPSSALNAAKYMLLDTAWTIADPIL
ncbi:hypothetical protein HED22_02730 [Thalassospira sp. HF15]|uniref:pentapeptide repeat-containing protein n=1 Tax=Thalassospira sp. HF15 TaxID=2722755 RepID=UPI00142FA42A|nr:pentapeptide repeat-containing protein [Thalassospira sp. HF15]NIY74550.1 hypothetical protein [Thalassospira sp. HF15]